MNYPAASYGLSSSLLGRHSVLDLACPGPDPGFAGMTHSPQVAGNTTQREFKLVFCYFR